MLLVLRSVIRIDAAGGRIPARAAVAWFALLLAGSTCYGPGIGAALVFPVALVLLLPAAWRQPGLRLAFLALPPVTLGLYFGLQYLYRQIGTLSIEEHVHQQAAFSGFDAIPLLWAHLLWYSAAGTVLGFFMPKSYPSPARHGSPSPRWSRAWDSSSGVVMRGRAGWPSRWRPCGPASTS